MSNKPGKASQKKSASFFKLQQSKNLSAQEAKWVKLSQMQPLETNQHTATKTITPISC
jgi:hypothetical protein